MYKLTWLFILLGLSVANAGEVQLTCDVPTLNDDGTPLTDLAGIRFYESQVTGGPYALVADEVVCATTLDRPAGDWFYVATAYNTADIESIYSNETTITVAPAAPAPPTNLVAAGNLVAYSISQTKDRLVTYPVGTVAEGTPCDSTMSANGLYLVSVDAVEFAGGANATVAFAECVSG